MSQRRGLWHKVGYACAIVALLLPLSYLSQPQTRDSKGGKLAQLREEYKLGQADLGEIDPTSEALKLATLGMRGVAANIMWHKANEFKKTENWTGFSAALEQITRLQPNFIAVWRFQAWNLSYNISTEFDDYHDRYYWVMKGINFIIGGTRYNANEPRLLYDIGWFISQKIGRADEHVQYRKLFKEDDEFHGDRKPADRDNWLVGREWYLQAQRVVDSGVPVKGTSPLVFHSYPSMALINYADALEEEGTYGEVAKNAWKNARESWREFGDRDIQSTYNVAIHLNDREKYEKRAKEAADELDKLAPGVRDQIRKEKIAALPKEDREVFEIEPAKLTSFQGYKFASMSESVRGTDYEVVDRIKGPERSEALRLADVATQSQQMATIIDRYRGIVNFDFWRLRCDLEQTADAVAARKAIFEADAAFKDSNLEVAKAKYDEGFARWRAVLDAFPDLIQQDTEIDELNEVVDRYRKLYEQLDLPFPDDFVLKDVVAAKEAKTPKAAPVDQDVTGGAMTGGDVTGGDPSQPDPGKKPAPPGDPNAAPSSP